MSRKALSYEQNLEKRGIEAAKDRLAKNQEKFDSKIEALKAEIAKVEAAKVQDAESFKAAITSYTQSLQNDVQNVITEATSEDSPAEDNSETAPEESAAEAPSDEGAATGSEELSEVL